MDELERKGIVTADDRGKFSYNREKAKRESTGKTTSRIRGTLFMTRRGFGFVSIEGTDDEIYIAPKYLHTALHSDVVEVVQFAGRPGRGGRSKGREDDRAEGEVVAILERKITQVTGRLESGRSSFFVVPDDDSLVAARTHHGETFASAVLRDNVLAVQFHPEKSQRAGLALLGAWLKGSP